LNHSQVRSSLSGRNDMLTTSFTSMRRLSGCVFTLLLSSVCLSTDVAAQTPSVVSFSAAAVLHNETYGAPWQTAVSNRGDFILMDFKSGGLFEYPANGGAEITLPPPSGGFTDSGIAIDPRNNNLYLNNNYNGGMLEYPFDQATGAWDLPAVTVASGLAGNLGGSCGNYFQGAGIAINDLGVMAVATENGCGVEIFTVPIDASGNFGSATAIVSNMSARAKTVAIDNAGNIYFNEDSGGLTGAYFIPAGTNGLTVDTGLTRIDPKLGNVQGVSVDRAGNIYIADGSGGQYLVPLQAGVPNPAQAILLTPQALATGGPSIDPARGTLFSPTASFSGIKDIVRIYLGRLELGTSAVGTTGATAGTVTYTFNVTTANPTITPYTFVIEENAATADFSLGDVSNLAGCGITFTTDPMSKKVTENATAYPNKTNGNTCSLPVTFTPHAVGDISATLVMMDSTGNVLNTTVLHGVGQSSEVVVAPATESKIGSALKTPSQIATDISGNIYIADNGLGKVLEYPKGSGATATPVSIGTGLTAPTGVAVDGTGDVFIADSGKLIEVPYGPSGLNAAGQAVVMSGLGTKLKLAVDKIGDVFVADPDNQRVLRIRNIAGGVNVTSITGLTQLSAIAAGSGALFVANGQNLLEYSALYAGTTVVNSLPTNVNGLAADASGAVYVSSAHGTLRIPNEGGTLKVADEIALAAGVASPTSVAVDPAGNAYVSDGTALNVDFLSANGSLNLGTLGTPTSTSTAIATVINDGNTPLTITGFSTTPDFSVTSTNCTGTTIAVGISCSATVTFNAGPGDQGTLSGKLLVNGNESNVPIGINVTGVGAPLAASKSTVTVSAKPTVTNGYSIVITVASSSGTGPVPTGNVTLTVTGGGATLLTVTQPLVNGAITLNPTTLGAVADTFAVSYAGDRVYGTSTASTTATIAPGIVTLIQPAASAVPTYVLSSGSGSQEPYDNSQQPFFYNYPVVVKTANGTPLVGVTLYKADNVTINRIDYGTVTYQLANGTPACSGSAGAVNVNADGTAPFGTNCLNIDTSNNQIPNIATSYTITPVYNGNAHPDYAQVTGSAFTVIAIRNPSVIITSNPAAVNVTAGSSATATLTLTSLLGYGITGVNGTLNNYSLPVELACDNLPAHATCTFAYPNPDPSDPNSVDVTPTTPGVVTMTVNTNAPVGTTSSIQRSPSEATYAAIFGLGLLGLALRGRKSLRGLVLTTICVLLCGGMVAGLTSCSSKQLGATPQLTTPAGTYTVTVTAKQTGSKVVPNPTAGGAPLTVYGTGSEMSIPFTMSITVK
jgi:sugar lactone lactonase YvrE